MEQENPTVQHLLKFSVTISKFRHSDIPTVRWWSAMDPDNVRGGKMFYVRRPSPQLYMPHGLCRRLLCSVHLDSSSCFLSWSLRFVRILQDNTSNVDLLLASAGGASIIAQSDVPQSWTFNDNAISAAIWCSLGCSTSLRYIGQKISWK